VPFKLGVLGYHVQSQLYVTNDFDKKKQKREKLSKAWSNEQTSRAGVTEIFSERERERERAE